MIKTEITITKEGIPTKVALEVELIEKHILLGEKRIPAFFTSTKQLYISFNANFGYADYTTYFAVKMTNMGKKDPKGNPLLPDYFLPLENYYLAAQEGKLHLLWEQKPEDKI